MFKYVYSSFVFNNQKLCKCASIVELIDELYIYIMEWVTSHNNMYEYQIMVN